MIVYSHPNDKDDNPNVTTRHLHTHLLGGDYATIEQGHKIKVQKTLSRLGAFGMHYNYAIDQACQRTAEAFTTVGRLMARVEKENQLFFRPSALANELGMSRMTLERHLIKIKEANLLVPDDREKDMKRGIHLWRICPFLMWRGTPEALRDYISDLPPDHVFFEYEDPASERRR
jgi:DNA-binding transcriptional ArsR family regulator